MTFEQVLKANGFTFDRQQGSLRFFGLGSIRAAIAISPNCDPQLSLATYRDDQTEARIIGHWSNPQQATEELPSLIRIWSEPRSRAC